MTTDPRYEINFDDNGENPQDWPLPKKALVIFIMSYSTLVVVMYSTSYTSGIPGMMATFGIHSKTLVVLGITTYLAGLALGSLLLAPLSEMYGRRPVYLIAVAIFTILIIPCALSNNLAQILVMRFFGAIAGAAMISNAPGTVSDIVSDDYRALAFSGFAYQALGWRWTNWVVMIGSGISWFFVFTIKETYAPAILRAKSARKRKETDDTRWHSRLTGLSYMGIGIGGICTIVSEPLLRKMINAHPKDPETGKPYPEAMVSVVCIPFGAGNCGVFIYTSNYLVYSYGIYAASALAGNAVLRSAMGGALPLAGPAMYATLGPHWSATMLSLIEFAMIPIPLVFYRYGHRIREKSALIRQMRKDREKLGKKRRAGRLIGRPQRP
ncbi:MFS general substrate transporter [Lizonia empirigonia]|nr:MFS general substrate transporter [Lizonia empirigonia]